MGQVPDAGEEKVVSLVGRQRKSRERQESIDETVDGVTKTLHYAMIAVQTSITLCRRRYKLPPLE